jgi:hypothetical protein
VQNALMQNTSIAHLRSLPIFPFALTFLCHFSIRTHFSSPFFGAARRRQNKTEQDYRVPWYPKNMLTFAPDHERAHSDRALLQVPRSFNIFDPKLLYWAGRGNDFGKLWERDMQDFARLFSEALGHVQSQNSLHKF